MRWIARFAAVARGRTQTAECRPERSEGSSSGARRRSFAVSAARTRRPKALAIACLLAFPASAQLLTSTPNGVVVATKNQLRLADRWTADGVEQPTAIVASDSRVVVLDALNNEAVVAELASGRTTRIDTAETPTAAAFVGDELYILGRDAAVVQRGETRIIVAADPAFMTAANGRLYVYSRTAGVVQELGRDRVTRSVQIAPFASDFEISGATAYLVYARDGRVRTVELETMRPGGEVAVGAVPVDLAFAGGGTALTARVLAVADPSAKRVWMTEGTQSTTQAVARGFLRGFLGLGLFGNRSSQFPTGVDRVQVRGKTWIAYDSSTGTLYRFDRKSSSVIARGVAPGAYTLTDDGVAWWTGTSVAQKTLR